MFQTLHFQQRIKRIILIYHAARRCISLMPQAATNEIEWLHSAFVFIRRTFRCIVHCINSSYSKYFKFRMFQTLHFQQRIKRIILIYHAARRCISLMPQAATNGIEWLHSAFVFIRRTFRCIVHCINSSYSKYSLLKKASEPLINS